MTDDLNAAMEVLANNIEALDSWEGCGDYGCHFGLAVNLAEVLALVRGAAGVTVSPPDLAAAPSQFVEDWSTFMEARPVPAGDERLRCGLRRVGGSATWAVYDIDADANVYVDDEERARRVAEGLNRTEAPETSGLREALQDIANHSDDPASRNIARAALAGEEAPRE